jgi:hypothetical protein
VKGGGKPLRVYISGAGVGIFPNNIPARASSFVCFISKIGIAVILRSGNFARELSVNIGLFLKSGFTQAAAIVNKDKNLISKILSIHLLAPAAGENDILRVILFN